MRRTAAPGEIVLRDDLERMLQFYEEVLGPDDANASPLFPGGWPAFAGHPSRVCYRLYPALVLAQDSLSTEIGSPKPISMSSIMMKAPSERLLTTSTLEMMGPAASQPLQAHTQLGAMVMSTVSIKLLPES